MRHVLALLLVIFLLLPAAASADVLESYQILVNKQNELPRSYVPSDLSRPDVAYAPGVLDERKQLRWDAARALEDMFNAAKEDGIELLAISGYRSYDSQKYIYEKRLCETDIYYVSRYVAKPGQSEHQTGLAMDIGIEGYLLLTPNFADTPAYAWILEHAHEYGYIVRYTENGEAETGYAYEPWHLRYVGVDLAVELRFSGQTLEAWYVQRMTGAHLAREKEFLLTTIGK